jgi:integrase
VRAVQTGAYREITPTTFAEYAEGWLQAQTTLKPSTRTGHTSALGHLVPVLGMLPLGEIGVSEVNGYLAAKADTLRPKTLTNHLSLLSKILSDAVAADRLAANRLARNRAVRRPQAITEDDEIVVEVPTHDEVNRALDALASPWREFFLTLASTGLRLGEALALRWQDFDADAGRLWVRRSCYRGQFFVPKTKHSARAVASAISLSQW